MDPLTIGLITGGANLVGSIFSSNTSAQNTQEQIAASQQQQATQNAFSQQMSSTAYQRATQDMQKAGLNPAMMFGSGSAASSPMGSGIQVPMSQRQSPLSGLGAAAQSVVQTAVTAKTMDKMTDEIARLQSEKSLLDKEAALTSQRTDTERQETVRRGNEASLTGLSLPGARFRASTAEDLLRLDPVWRRNAVKGAFYAGKVGDMIDPVAQLGSSVTGLGRFLNDRSFKNRYYFGE